MKMAIVGGPTAVGKTDLMVEVCEEINAEIVSMDSRQIYRYMDIGTAKPTPEQRKRVPHHMIDILDPDEYYNAFLYRKDSLKAVEDILKRGKIPVYVGGTGLYADALVRGIFEGVPADENIRKELRELERREPGILRKMLEEFDPEAATRIHPNDLKRTIRALEVYMKTGRRISELQKETKGDDRFFIIVLTRERYDLYDRINRRVDRMVEMGLVDEVKRLLSMGYSKDLNSMKTIGYKEVIEYLEGKYDFEKMVHLIKRNTRHFARRQIIWFKRYENAIWYNLTFVSKEELKKTLKELIVKNFSV
ncbi:MULTISPECIES: tRNA (adenosine(37)-N6)-dimethylallyltransferase MiaA [Thermotoga]|uniref:tRNA dimethylallyltransferase n=1 Tax=Thermotoga neapolitana (strain ATCC 49049 / DSM 4359 / NBRC 107923 / NS-E) TaxID=309803 RepID=MIAA_THENN|nr:MULTISPECIES: tRNA (adenosine(37)-N6)-dimethylallyltransferase MiaA [Thermotoga]B9KBC5.1 RecName: Full=tRNA dimethylallyltransferase; AltName: Full=Dimethylallyl diphosphate:tRNA dimethylallyltransferase; Short=DMAPP:tRNA dimethylallyltransferase; Short=DMATase; AltName: Full=Isopentenyl-diphosphate:tRNA isopentenyltransferase; Short=IPP transferase; Short=IPPT; Short=IPTase [Thermotoga neapolitana DSM 4359]ACM22321.1 tRNA delta(2)-isopentenylpyrophosphate transferase [Thermotoga neapolitana D